METNLDTPIATQADTPDSRAAAPRLAAEGARPSPGHPRLTAGSRFVYLTESGELVSAMSAAVGRLRHLAAAAFDAGREDTNPATAALEER